jgi:ADP-ribose pyrophosphatase YjhB (NUDIX family)
MARIRSAGIVVKDGKILLMHRTYNGQKVYVFPGGGVKEGETMEEACAREILEETSIKVKVGRLVCKGMWEDNPADSHFYYLCDYISGEPHLDQNSPEVEEIKKGESWHNPEWQDISEMPNLPIWPIKVRDEIIDGLKNGFSEMVREIKKVSKK